MLCPCWCHPGVTLLYSQLVSPPCNQSSRVDRWDSGRFQLAVGVREQLDDILDSFVINGGLILRFLEENECEKMAFFTCNLLTSAVKFLMS